MRRTLKHIFGPVASRRLGRSLGVELTPFKTCSFDCVYCEVGRTTHETVARAAYVPTAELLEELAVALADRPPLDYVTLAGSGEPTLHADIGPIIRGIRELTATPIAILTNGSLLGHPDVRRACSGADLILPTLAAHDEAAYQRIHRPVEGLTLEKHIAGLVAFREECGTEMWLELFLLEGLNATAADRAAFMPIIERIAPDRVQLNTAVRPTADVDATAVSAATLDEWARALGPLAEVIANVQRPGGPVGEAEDHQVLALCQRRPCTLDQIADGLGMLRPAVAKSVARLKAQDRLSTQWKNGQEFYVGE